jgi:hypothetical protein
MSQLPAWVQYLSALGPLVVALIVAFIGFLQWRTAHQNVVLQLFQRRVAKVDELRGAVREIRAKAKVQNGESNQFHEATRGAEFLFGSELITYLDRIYEVVLDLHVCDAELQTADGDEGSELVKKRRQLRNELDAFFPMLNKLVAPYVKMHQKQLWI